MDKRTKILVSLFGAAIAYALLTSWVYPQWIVPLLTLTDRVAEAQATLDKLEKHDSDFQNAKREYRRLVERVGALDIGKVENTLRVKLDELISKHKLEGASVAPSRGTSDKSGIDRMNVSINAVGSLQAVVGFMQDVAELPQLIRVGNVTIYPASGGKRSERADRLNMRLPIEVVVLPQQKMLGEKLTEKDLKQPEKIVRHSGRDFSAVWKKTPFIEFVPLPTLVVNAGQPQTVPVGQSVMLQGGATGGDGKYTYEWSGDGMPARALQSVPADTSAIGQKNYTLVVRDGSENSASARVTITVIEPLPPPPDPVVRNEPPPPPPPPMDPVRITWPDRNMRQVAMTLETKGVPGREGELLVVNQGTRERTYHAVGDEFDGGKLVYVDTRGGIVKWKDKFYIYPLGAKLDQDIPADSATNHPDLLRIVERLKLADAAPGPQVAPEDGAPPQSPPVNNDKVDPGAPQRETAPVPEQVGQLPNEGVPAAQAGGEVAPPTEVVGAPQTAAAPEMAPTGEITPPPVANTPEHPLAQNPQAAAPETQAVVPAPTEGTALPAPAPVEAATAGTIPPAGEAVVAPPAVKDVVKERPSKAKTRRPARPKPAPLPPPAQEEAAKEKKSEQKQE